MNARSANNNADSLRKRRVRRCCVFDRIDHFFISRSSHKEDNEISRSAFGLAASKDGICIFSHLELPHHKIFNESVHKRFVLCVNVLNTFQTSDFLKERVGPRLLISVEVISSHITPSIFQQNLHQNDFFIFTATRRQHVKELRILTIHFLITQDVEHHQTKLIVFMNGRVSENVHQLLFCDILIVTTRKLLLQSRHVI